MQECRNVGGFQDFFVCYFVYVFFVAVFSKFQVFLLIFSYFQLFLADRSGVKRFLVAFNSFFFCVFWPCLLYFLCVCFFFAVLAVQWFYRFLGVVIGFQCIFKQFLEIVSVFSGFFFAVFSIFYHIFFCGFWRFLAIFTGFKRFFAGFFLADYSGCFQGFQGF